MPFFAFKTIEIGGGGVYQTKVDTRNRVQLTFEVKDPGKHSML